MRLWDLPGLAVFLANSPIASDPIWQREADKLSETEIQLFYARSGLAGFLREAIDAIERAQTVAIRSALSGQQGMAAIVLHVPPADRFFVDDLVDVLAKLRPCRRIATLYALEQKLDPTFVVNLTWTTLGSQGHTELAAAIIEHARKTRHIRLPYVFWEWVTEQVATPLLDLKISAEQAFGLSWPAIVQRYDQMVLIDRRADRSNFLELLEKLPQ